MNEFFRQHVDPSKLKPVVRRKWSPDTLREGFVPFPKMLLRTIEKILPSEDSLGLLVTLMSIIDFRGASSKTSGPSIEYLAFIGDVDVGVTKTRIQKLNKLGLISWDEIELEDRTVLVFNLDGLLNKIIELGEPKPPIDHSDIPFLKIDAHHSKWGRR